LNNEDLTKIQINVRIPRYLKEQLERYSERRGFTFSDVVIIFLQEGLKYDMASEGWYLRLQEGIEAKVKAQLEAKKQLITYQHELRNKEGETEAIRSMKIETWKAYLKSLDPREIKGLVESKFGLRRVLEGEAPHALPVEVSGGYKVVVNGWERIAERLDNGLPKGGDVKPYEDKLEPCENGFHVRGTWCKGTCMFKDRCELIRKERIGL